DPAATGWCANNDEYGCLTGGAGCAPGCFSLGFTFDYYGTGYSCVYVNSNGYLVFGASPTPCSTATGSGGTPCNPATASPSTADPNGVVAGYWTNMIPFYCGWTG